MYSLPTNWPTLVHALGINPGAVLRRAGLPPDLLIRQYSQLSPTQFVAFWNASEAEFDGENLPLRMAQVVAPSQIDPMMLAGLASPDLAAAADRIATYKRLCSPLELKIALEAAEFRIAPVAEGLPASVLEFEVLFWVGFARVGTGDDLLAPREVRLPAVPPAEADLRAFLGECELVIGPPAEVVFSAADARRPFVTADAHLWDAFAPVLGDADADPNRPVWTPLVTQTLAELLPAGRSSVEVVAETLHLSARSLQRKLREEGTTFSEQLADSRVDLARHYLSTTDMADSQVAFLLGFDDSRSLHRLVRQNTGVSLRALRGGQPQVPAAT